MFIEYVDEACPPWEGATKHIHGNHYRFMLRRGDREYTSDFWNSYKDAMKEEIKRSEMFDPGWKTAGLKRKAKNVMPTAYDVLACLDETDDEQLMGPLQDFIDEYGYENADHAIATREKLKAETLGLRRLFSQDELAQLSEVA